MLEEKFVTMIIVPSRHSTQIPHTFPVFIQLDSDKTELSLNPLFTPSGCPHFPLVSVNYRTTFFPSASFLTIQIPMLSEMPSCLLCVVDREKKISFPYISVVDKWPVIYLICYLEVVVRSVFVSGHRYMSDNLDRNLRLLRWHEKKCSVKSRWDSCCLLFSG